MPLGEVARCWRCHCLKNDSELRLNRRTWEYECAEGCEERKRAVYHVSGFTSTSKRKRYAQDALGRVEV